MKLYDSRLGVIETCSNSGLDAVSTREGKSDAVLAHFDSRPKVYVSNEKYPHDFFYL